MHTNCQNPVLEFSPFLKQLVTRHPDWLEELQDSGRLNNSNPPEMSALLVDIKDHGLDPALRRFRNREMLRLVWRDLGDLAPVDEILADLSVLADICLQAAVDHHGASRRKTTAVFHRSGRRRGGGAFSSH